MAVETQTEAESFSVSLSAVCMLFVNHSKEFKLVFVYLNIGLGQLSKSV